jgi:hypothetical protein
VRRKLGISIALATVIVGIGAVRATPASASDYISYGPCGFLANNTSETYYQLYTGKARIGCGNTTILSFLVCTDFKDNQGIHNQTWCYQYQATVPGGNYIYRDGPTMPWNVGLQWACGTPLNPRWRTVVIAYGYTAYSGWSCQNMV